MSFHPLTNAEIDELLKDIKHVAPTVAKDRLPKRIKNIEYRVINLDDNSGSGTHWTAYVNDSKNCFYFDSFGMAPPDIVVNYLKKAHRPIYYNSSQIQHHDSIMCGFYCVDFIRQYANDKPIYDILYEYEQQATKFNEKLIQQKARNF